MAFESDEEAEESMSQIDTILLQPQSSGRTELTEEQKLKNELISSKKRYEEEKFYLRRRLQTAEKEKLEAENLKKKSLFDATEEGIAYNDYMAANKFQQKSQELLEK